MGRRRQSVTVMGIAATMKPIVPSPHSHHTG